MFKKPFTTQNINITDGGYVNLIPAYDGRNQVLITQDMQHKVLDSTTTRFDDVIASGNLVQPAQYLQPLGLNYGFNPLLNLQPCPQFVQNPQNFIGWNATQNFVPPQCFQDQQFYPQQPQTLQQQMAFNAAQKNGLEAMLMQEQMRINQFQLEQMRKNQLEQISNQFQLRFHQDKPTSTSDLLDGVSQIQQSRGLPDFKNISGVIEQKLNEFTCDCNDPNHFSMEHVLRRQLNLTKSPDLKAKPKEIVVTENNSEPNQKRVTYKDTQECTTQTNKTKKKRSKCCNRKKKSGSDESENTKKRSPCRKCPRKAINKKDSAVTITTSSTSESTDSEHSETRKTKRKRKNKKRCNCRHRPL